MKSSNRFSGIFDLIDIPIIAVVLVLSFLFLNLFFKTINSISNHTNTDNAAIITFRKNKAQRQYPDSLKWERLQNESPVFNEDTIRTGGDSEASLNFEDNTKLDLSDNTLIKIKTSLKKNEIVFSGGSFSMKRDGNNTKDISVNTNDGSVITFSKDSVTSIIDNEGIISVGVDKGNATIEKNGQSQSIDRSGEIRLDSVSGEINIIKRNIFPVQPEPDMRFITVDRDFGAISFTADTENILQASSIFLELSDNPGFTLAITKPVTDITNTAYSITTDITPGVWYWRFTVKNSENENAFTSSARRFILYKDTSVQGITPLPDESFSYRTRKPDVSFNWTETAHSDSYILELSRDKDFNSIFSKTRTSFPSMRLTGFDEGTWYWRVTPAYPFVTDSAQFTSSINSFSVKRHNEMDKPETFLPVDKSLFEIVRASNKGLGFSWKKHPEAERYQFALANDYSMNNIVISEESQVPYIRLKPSQLTGILKEARWYWGVRVIDSEGNYSAWSTVKEINSIDAALSQRLIYPPDNYIISDSLISNTRFTWYSNIPAKKYFQISKDPKFLTIYYNREIDADTLIGRNWEPGKWYWRIRTLNADKTVFLDSEIRSFEIIPPFKEVMLTNPQHGSSLIIYDEKIKTLTWQPVENADYYSVVVAINDGQTPILQLPLYEKTSLDFDAGKYSDMKITVILRAGANEKDNATRILGLIGTSEFLVKRLKPVKLIEPQPGSTLNGLNVFRNGFKVVWSSEEIITASTLVITADMYGKNVIFQKNNPATTEIIKTLKEGTYYFNVSAMTDIGYEISATKSEKFIIAPVPLLPEANIITPLQNTIIDFNYLKTNKAIIFKWEKVANATDYTLSLWNKNSNKLLFEKNDYKDTTYIFTELKKLQKGTFVWKLEAQSIHKDILEQRGKVATMDFTLDIPEVNTGAEKRNEGLYGK